MKNIHVLPTDKPSRLFIDIDDNKLKITQPIGGEYMMNQHIYITNDEEIKEGDWCIDKHNVVYKQETDKIFTKFNGAKKIILTTDPDLIKDGVQAIDDEFLEWFVKNPSCEEIKIDKINLCTQTGLPCGMQCLSKETCNKNISYKIIIPKEETNYNMKQEIEWVSNNLQCKQVDSCYNSLSKKCVCPKEEPKTSEEWQKQFPNTKVLDPDGWDRKNYQYSWFEEKITLIEYTSRLLRSTVRNTIPKEEPKPHSFCETPESKCTMNYCDENGCQNRKRELVEPQEEPKQETLTYTEAAKKEERIFNSTMMSKQETLEEFANNYSKDPFVITGVLIGAKWQKERSYSEEEVYNLLYKLLPDKQELDDWFEQFKKK